MCLTLTLLHLKHTDVPNPHTAPQNRHTDVSNPHTTPLETHQLTMQVHEKMWGNTKQPNKQSI